MDNEKLKKLLEPFKAEDIEWRLQHTNQEHTSGYAIPYLTNRAIQNKLDEIFGSFGWSNEFKEWQINKPEIDEALIFKTFDKNETGLKNFTECYYSMGLLCGISIKDPDSGELITKWDGAENSDIEPVKGGISDSMKRAAVQWGIGRYLYGLEGKWVNIEQKGRSYIIKNEEYSKLVKHYNDMLQGKLPQENSGNQPTDGNTKSSGKNQTQKKNKPEENKNPETPSTNLIKIKLTKEGDNNGKKYVRFITESGEEYFADKDLDRFTVGAEIDLTKVLIEQKGKNKIISFKAA